MSSSACTWTAPISGSTLLRPTCLALSDRSTARNPLGQMAHSPTGLLLRGQLEVRQSRLGATRCFTVTQAQRGDMARPPAAVILGIDLGRRLFEAFLVRFPQRA